MSRPKVLKKAPYPAMRACKPDAELSLTSLWRNAYVFGGSSKVEISRFKGLGEMPPDVLKETTMRPGRRVLLRVLASPDEKSLTDDVVESLMGRRPELRFQVIQEHAGKVRDLDI